MIIDVVNHADRTEIELLAYPLDHRQRPRLELPSQGRFIAVMPGFADPLRYPQGRFMTLRGRFAGPRDAMASAPADLPRMRVQSEYLWPRGFRQDGPQFRIGIGVTL
jgi:outer membrane lipoprotein